MTPKKLHVNAEGYVPVDIKSISGSLTTQDLDNYLSCPLRFAHLRQHGGDPFSEILGLLVRRGLSVFYAEPVNARTPKLVKRIARTLWHCLLNEDREDGIAPSFLIDEFASFADEAYKEDLDDLYKAFRESLLGSSELDQEPYVIAWDRQLSFDVSGITITGTVDRVDVEGGKAVIVHYGTETHRQTSDFRLLSEALLYDEATKEDDFALPVAGGRHQDLVERSEREIKVTASLLDDTFDKTEEAVRGIFRLVEEGQARPIGNPRLCKTCPLFRSCPSPAVGTKTSRKGSTRVLS